MKNDNGGRRILIETRPVTIQWYAMPRTLTLRVVDAETDGQAIDLIFRIIAIQLDADQRPPPIEYPCWRKLKPDHAAAGLREIGFHLGNLRRARQAGTPWQEFQKPKIFDSDQAGDPPWRLWAIGLKDARDVDVLFSLQVGRIDEPTMLLDMIAQVQEIELRRALGEA